ncbi:hypothetical protein [Sinorhizobium meliloti]|uniref:hypothetical protein n=1 Tax=Rhizobium meliloti TaxID=382 RepID=UPI000B4A0428|nr:hypothetical protein [Sinorhizobium meliloti]ASP90766.1 hypothetical protein CDO25_05860 [Sinorhizobium meliloti]MDW9578881.1 hypothetical protein [Sinorhizobium meliloti]MDW9814961.1 hypothetical protein [Sinorhizobium meliloti]MQX60131.1 hypothetical protein [Sinorhizobium meliloti]
MSKHTPGPWTARQQFANRWLIEKDQGTNDAGEKLIPLCLAAVHTTILEVGCGERDTEANARLISAAPDLLEALRGFLSAFPLPLRKDEKEAIEAAKTAIAKAEGRS